MKPGGTLVPATRLSSFVVALLEGLGLPRQHAEDTARALVDADLAGAGTHGVRLLPPYAARLRTGAIAVAPQLQVLSRTGAVSVLDGGNGLGQVVAAWAVRHSIEVARQLGAAITTVRRSNHLGALGSFTRMAAEEGMVCFLTQNTRTNMAPAGGREAAVGNNPFSFAVPSSRFPVVLDLACSAVARSNIDLAAERGEPIPQGWALGRDGRPTTDAQQGLLGAVLPFAGHKGSGLAVVMGALAGALSGANFGAAVPPLSDYSRERDLGHFLLVVDLAALGDTDELLARMDRYVGEISGSAPAPGVDRVRVPGEAADARRRQCEAAGIALPATLVHALTALADDVGVRPGLLG